MRYLLTSSVTLFFAAPVLAEDTALGQATKAIRPVAEASMSYAQRSVVQNLATGEGPLADGAEKALAKVERQ